MMNSKDVVKTITVSYEGVHDGHMLTIPVRDLTGFANYVPHRHLLEVLQAEDKVPMNKTGHDGLLSHTAYF